MKMWNVVMRNFSLGLVCALAGVVAAQAVWAPQAVAAGNPVVEAPRSSDTEILAGKILAEEIAIWMEKLPSKPLSTAIVEIRAKAPLSGNFPIVFEAELLSEFADRLAEMKIMQCFACRALKTAVLDDQIMVKRGVPSIDDLKKHAQDLKVESFLLIEVFRTSNFVTGVVTLFAANGEVIASRSISTNVMELAGGATTIGLQAGIGFAFGGPDGNSGNPPFSGSVFMLQDLGENKGGLYLGGFSAEGKGAGYVAPSLGWMGRGPFGLSSLLTVGAGAGMGNKSYGLAVRGGYFLRLGFALFGVDAAAIIPFSKKGDSPDGIVAMTLGISFGR